MPSQWAPPWHGAASLCLNLTPLGFGCGTLAGLAFGGSVYVAPYNKKMTCCPLSQPLSIPAPLPLQPTEPAAPQAAGAKPPVAASAEGGSRSGVLTVVVPAVLGAVALVAVVAIAFVVVRHVRRRGRPRKSRPAVRITMMVNELAEERGDELPEVDCLDVTVNKLAEDGCLDTAPQFTRSAEGTS